ncbi:rhomboid family intramembrane serine protease [Propionicicella superfundia]|uniref:rhomboid family intramembrane serine protease n=1 Tax=Propionicicella superfundia TaxID=348582 RepID=UPI00048A7B7B|nr:rhomboid family intramembrane serine protease [Propionicicella superfundia]
MSGLFAARGPSSEPWFRVGRFEVTTTLAVVVLVVASWIVWAATPDLVFSLYYSPETMGVELWRLVTWPLANQPSLWGILNLFFFWYFATNLENTIGRTRMLRLLLGIWASLTVAATVVGLTIGGGALAGIGMIQLVILLIWIAEYPTMRFFFNIPAWVIGVVLVALQVLMLIAARSPEGLLSLALSLVLVAVVARMVGLLTAYPWIPGGRRAGRPRSPRPSRAQRSQAKNEQRRMTDRERLDLLLDQIGEQGIHSLSSSQRRELLRLRDRLRGQ